MAERSIHTMATGSGVMRLRMLAATGAGVLVISGLPPTGTPPPPPATRPERVRPHRAAATTASAALPRRALRWWGRLRSALPAIGRAPTSRPDTPALPTVGKPRDAPGHRAGTGAFVASWATKAPSDAPLS